MTCDKAGNSQTENILNLHNEVSSLSTSVVLLTSPPRVSKVCERCLSEQIFDWRWPDDCLSMKINQQIIAPASREMCWGCVCVCVCDFWMLKGIIRTPVRSLLQLTKVKTSCSFYNVEIHSNRSHFLSIFALGSSPVYFRELRKLPRIYCQFIKLDFREREKTTTIKLKETV